MNLGTGGGKGEKNVRSDFGEIRSKLNPGDPFAAGEVPADSMHASTLVVPQSSSCFFSPLHCLTSRYKMYLFAQRKTE